MARKRTQYTAQKNPMQELLKQERRRAEKAMKEIHENDGEFSAATNAWLLEMGHLGEEDAKQVYFGQAIRGLMPDCDWALMEQWAKDIAKTNPGFGNYMLGCLFNDATPGPVDYEKSKRYFQLGAAAGFEECNLMLEDMERYEEKDKLLSELSEILNSTADEPDYERYRQIHYYCQQQENYKEARKHLKLWLKEAPKDEEALLQMATYYANGLGVTKSYKQAYKYYQLATDGGSVEGLFYIGLMHYAGNGCVQDYEKAVECFTKAAQQQYSRAYYYLGLCCDLGCGTAQNPEQAHEYYKTGAAQNDPECHIAMAQAYMCGLVVAADFKKAERHLKKARKALPTNAGIIEDKLFTAERMLIFYRGSI